MSVDPKEGEEKTLDSNGQAIEKEPVIVDDTTKTNIIEEAKKVEVEETELEKLRKKAADFDGLVEKQRLAKLDKKESKPVADDDVQNKLAELQAEINSFKAEKTNDILKEAYQDFVKENPWATADEYFNKISENFSADGLTSKDGITAKLRAITINLFPTEFSQHKEREIKAKALAEAAQINAGGGSGTSNNTAAKGEEKVDPLQKLKDRYNSTLPKGYTAIKK